MRTLNAMRCGWLTLLLLFAGNVWAQANLDVDTPAIGLTRDGYIALREPNAVPLPQRQQVNGLVAAENQDRAALYKEISRANGHAEWENDIRTTFAQRWIDKAAGGWYYQNNAGAWTRK